MIGASYAHAGEMPEGCCTGESNHRRVSLLLSENHPWQVNSERATNRLPSQP